jgi:hypothetical protein
MFDLIIDVANACRDERLGGSGTSWDRFDRVMSAWRQFVNPHSCPLLVADDNLARDFRDRASRERWAAQVRGGTMLTTPHADSVILDTARSTGAAVLSRDGFVAHRRVHSWIQGDSEHFWRWTVDRDGRVEIRLEPMGVRNDYSITRAVERGDLKRLGLEDAELREAVLARVYKCDNLVCPLSVSVMSELPAVSQGRPICPSCRRPLRDRGPRPPGRRLKFLIGGQEVGSEVLGDGELVTLGTAPSSATTIDVSEFGEAGRINHSHLKLSVLGGQIVVEPMAGSPAQVQRWRDRRWQAPEELAGSTTLLHRDRVILPSEFTIEQSAREYVVSDFY